MSKASEPPRLLWGAYAYARPFEALQLDPALVAHLNDGGELRAAPGAASVSFIRRRLERRQCRCAVAFCNKTAHCSFPRLGIVRQSFVQLLAPRAAASALSKELFSPRRTIGVQIEQSDQTAEIFVLTKKSLPFEAVVGLVMHSFWFFGE
jgi:hypothetical protein